MNFIEFKNYIQQITDIDPFILSDERDSVASESEIVNAEIEFGVSFPALYKQFVKEYGGGDFAFTNIFSCDKEGEWYIVNKNKEASEYLPSNFIAISDDQSGGFYGYIVNDNKCNDKIYYWDYENSFFDKKVYDDIIDFILKIGLNADDI